MFNLVHNHYQQGGAINRKDVYLLHTLYCLVINKTKMSKMFNLWDNNNIAQYTLKQKRCTYKGVAYYGCIYCTITNKLFLQDILNIDLFCGKMYLQKFRVAQFVPLCPHQLHTKIHFCSTKLYCKSTTEEHHYAKSHCYNHNEHRQTNQSWVVPNSCT